MATRGAAALIAVVAALASVSLAMSPSVVTENGQLVLEVAAGTRVQVVYVDESGSRTGQPEALITKAEVEQMLASQMQMMMQSLASVKEGLTSNLTAHVTKEIDTVNSRYDALDARLTQTITDTVTPIEDDIVAVNDRYDALDARVKQNVTDLVTMIENEGATRDIAIGSLQNALDDKAEKDALLSSDDVKAIVAELLGQDSPLAAALAAKLDAAQAFTRTDAIALVNDLVNGAVGDGEGDTLRSVLDALTERIVALEDATEDSCGRHCRSGEFVKSACTEDAPTVCEDCPQESFSLGGLPTACTSCKTCAASEFETSSCTPSSDRACQACGACTASQWEKSPCTTTANIVCAACSTCGDDEYLVTECSAKADTVCTSCTTCADDEDVAVPCSASADTICVKKNLGFRAAMTESLLVTATGYKRLVGNNMWSTSSGTFPSLFQNGDHFNNGIFQVPIDGYYFISAQVRFDRITSEYIRLIASIGDPDLWQLHTIRGQVNHDYYSLTISGTAFLRRGDQLSLYVYSHSDGNFDVENESGFSVYRLPATEGMFAGYNTVYTVGGDTWHVPGPLIANGRGMRFTLPSTNVLAGDQRGYIAQSDGVYLVSAINRIDGANAPYFRLIVALDGDLNLEGVHTIEGSPPTNYFSMHVTGLVRATAGQRLAPVIESKDTGPWNVYTESSFSVMKLSTSVAFAADIVSDTNPGSDGYFVVPKWRTSGSSGLFDTTNGAFEPNSGVFTAPVTGIYYAACDIRVDGAGGGYVRIILDVSRDGGNKYDNGLHHIRSRMPAYYTGSPSGVMRLRKDDTLSVVVQSYGDGDYTIQRESGFFVALLHEE